MPRIRSIKPELPSDEKLARVSIQARYTFVLLITQADDDGLLRAESRQLLGQLYPYDDTVTTEMLSGWLQELADAGRIRLRKTVDGGQVAEVVNFNKHQLIRKRAKPHLANLLEPLPGDGRSSSGEVPGACREKSCADVDLGSRTMDLGPLVENDAQDTTLAETQEAFEAFWRAYPSRSPKTNPKAPAAERFAKLVAGGEVAAETLIAQAAAYGVMCRILQTPPKWIMMASSFLGEKEGWRSDYTPNWNWLKDLDDEITREIAGKQLAELIYQNDAPPPGWVEG